MNKGAAEMDEGSGERQRRDRDGWSEQRPGLYGGHGCTGGDESSRRCTEEIQGKEAFGEMTSQEVGEGGDNEQKAGCACLCTGVCLFPSVYVL